MPPTGLKIPPATPGFCEGVASEKADEAAWAGATGEAAVAKSAKSVDYRVNGCWWFEVACFEDLLIPSASEAAEVTADLAPPKRPLSRSAMLNQWGRAGECRAVEEKAMFEVK